MYVNKVTNLLYNVLRTLAQKTDMSNVMYFKYGLKLTKYCIIY